MNWKNSEKRLRSFILRKIKIRKKRRGGKNRAKSSHKEENIRRKVWNQEMKEIKMTRIFHQLEKSDFPQRKIIEGIKTDIAAIKIGDTYRFYAPKINRALLVRERRRARTYGENLGRTKKNINY